MIECAANRAPSSLPSQLALEFSRTCLTVTAHTIGGWEAEGATAVSVMSVSDMILELRTRAIADIERLQDFHVFTGHSYDRYEKMVAAGHLTGTVTNVRTRAAQTEKEVADLLLSYLDNELPQVVLYQLVSEFERFFFDFLKFLMQQNPRALSQKRQLTVEEVVAHSHFDEANLLSDRAGVT